MAFSLEQSVFDEHFDDYLVAIKKLLAEGSKVIIMLVGAAGSGKTRFRSLIWARLELDSNVGDVFCLDDYRVTKAGEYPKTANEHKMINRIAIPKFQEDVLHSSKSIIIVDNTHLKWDPDWKTVVHKALKSGYYLLPITAPITERMFIVNVSVHLGKDEAGMKIFWQMVHQWFGYKFSPMVYHIIPPEIVGKMSPLKRDNFPKVKTFKWADRAYLYILDNYLGFIDQKVVEHTIKAGYLMKNCCIDDYFLKKDGIIHMTLVSPCQNGDSKSSLQELASALIKNSTPPETVYTGIAKAGSEKNCVYFITVDKRSADTWENLINTYASQFGLRANPDHVHVTLGYSKTDVHGIEKCVVPLYGFTNDVKTERLFSYLPRYKGFASINIQDMPENVDINAFADWFSKVTKLAVNKLRFTIPKEHLENLSWFCNDGNIRMKIRICLDQYFLVSVSVAGRSGLDDEIYKARPILQQRVPRGLNYLMHFEPESNHLVFCGCVYPTSKFFGDEDADLDTKIPTTEEWQVLNRENNNFFSTEKANGEMFTVSCFEISKSNYQLVIGTKFNKFLFSYIPGQTTKNDVLRMIKWYADQEGTVYPINFEETRLQWKSYLWIEACEYFLCKLTSSSKSDEFCRTLADRNLTASGEFESWLHPHLLTFPERHRMIKWFAITGYQSDGTPAPSFLTERLKFLKAMRSWGFDTVDFASVAKNSIVTIRDKIREERGCEGSVILVCAGDEIKMLLKIKTIWYVVNRCFREQLRHILENEASAINYEEAYRRMAGALESCLFSFQIKRNSTVAREWQEHIDLLLKQIRALEDSQGRRAVIDLFETNYPVLITTAEALLQEKTS